jgi:hypothetical protein
MTEPITARALTFRRVASTSSWNLARKFAGTVWAPPDPMSLGPILWGGADRYLDNLQQYCSSFRVGWFTRLRQWRARFFRPSERDAPNQHRSPDGQARSIAWLLFSAVLAGRVNANRPRLAYYLSDLQSFNRGEVSYLS